MGNSFTTTSKEAPDAGGGAESISPTTTSSTDESLERRLKQLDAEKASGAVQTMIQQDDEETDKKNEDAQAYLGATLSQAFSERDLTYKEAALREQMT